MTAPASYIGNQYASQQTGDRRSKIVNKTTDYTVLPSDVGKVFTTLGAVGAVVFTLPAPTTDLTGAELRFINMAAQDMRVAAAAVDTLITYGDLTADSLVVTVGAATAVGASIWCYCTGVSWIASANISANQVATVAT